MLGQGIVLFRRDMLQKNARHVLDLEFMLFVSIV